MQAYAEPRVMAKSSVMYIKHSSAAASGLPTKPVHPRAMIKQRIG